MQPMIIALFAVLTLTPVAAATAQDRAAGQTPAADTQVRRLENKLDEAIQLLQHSQAQIAALTTEVMQLKAQLSDALLATASSQKIGGAVAQPDSERQDAFRERVLGTDLGKDERGHQVPWRPEIFLQTRYSALPHAGATSEDVKPNFRLSRIETRWSGRVSERIGFGLELQYHPAPDGAPEELVNDAFVEYYLNDHGTMKVGQFVKPFGFDIQQSSSMRESPERAMFAGYFFPGQRDRGIVWMGDLGFLSSPVFHNMQYFLGAFNGNRFFTDSNRQLNYLMRVRKHFKTWNLAAGASAQWGRQLLPPGVRGNNAENAFGIDVQYAAGRFGLRGELVAGNTPSTRLGIQPEFTPAFRPGKHSAGGAVLASLRMTEKDNAYARYDQFNGDPVSGSNVRAFNFGYFRLLGKFARLGLDYQLKNRPSFNDDAVNTRLQMTWNLLF